MSQSQFEWFPAITQALVELGGLFFLVAALVFTLLNRHRCPRPASLLIWALSLLLIAHVGSRIATYVFVQVFPDFQIATYFFLSSAISLLVTTAAYVLVIKAVFADRSPTIPITGNDSSAGRPLADQPNDNPYAAPHQ